MMNKDKSLEEIFGNFSPCLGSEEDFMIRLNKKLDAVEYIKEMQRQQVRHYRYAMIAVFVMGMVVGGGLFAYILSAPKGVPMFSFGINALPFAILEENSRMLCLIVLSLLMSAGATIIANMVHELLNMRMMPSNRVGALS